MASKKMKNAFKKSLDILELTSASVSFCSEEVLTLWSRINVSSKSKVFESSLCYKQGDTWKMSSGFKSTSGPYVTSSFGPVMYSIYKEQKDNDEIFLLDCYKYDTIQNSWNLSDLELHGKVYDGSPFNTMSVIGNSLIYLAEKKSQKSVPFFKSSLSSDKNQKSFEGGEYIYKETWGEQLNDFSESVIVYYDGEENFKILEGVPEGYVVTEIVFDSPTTIVGVAYKTEPFRLGLIYCNNRPSIVFRLNIISREFKEISSSDTLVGCFNVRYDFFTKTTIWFERDLTKRLYPGPHLSGVKIMKLKNGSPSLLLDNSNELPVFGSAFVPARCFIDGWLIFTSPYNWKSKVIAIELETGRIKSMDFLPNNLTILDMHKNVFVGRTSSLGQPPQIYIGHWITHENSCGQVLSKDPKDDKIKIETKIHKPKDGSETIFNSILSYKSGFKSYPLIVWPHGGPHSSVSTSFNRIAKFFMDIGYALLIINFTGSLGITDDNVFHLLGKVGDKDVKDCQSAIEEYLELKSDMLDASSTVLFGGSHGGFLVTHLAGQYPTFYKAVVARNPVINIASMTGITDIPDWAFNECGLNYEYLSPTPDKLKIMYEKSPIIHAKNVQAPVFLMIGMEDLRVPPSQGLEYYKTLKSLSKDVRMNVYKDNHPLAKPDVFIDVIMNTAIFYNSILSI